VKTLEPEDFEMDEKNQMQGKGREKGREMMQEPTGRAKGKTQIGGLAGWLLGRLRSLQRTPPRLAVLERITIAPRQSLALVEAEGRRFLVATSPEGTPAFYALDVRSQISSRSAATPQKNRPRSTRSSADRDLRVSW
jgi:Flagellar biosynthesis protein, FliO